MMLNEDILLSLAESGIAIAGFSGVILAMSGSPINEDGDKGKLIILLLSAFSASMFSFLPLLFISSGMSEYAALRTSSILLSAVMAIGGVGVLVDQSKKVGKQVVLVAIPMVFFFAMLLAVAFGLLTRSIFFVYFMALFGLLFLAVSSFFLLVITRAK